jgi:polyferredoxin
MTKTRQRVRKALILISLLLLPVTLYYFSPALILEGANEGIVVGSFIVFVGVFVASLALGRGFCGWACPLGGLQEGCFAARDRRVNGRRFDWIKWLIWVPWVALIIVFIVMGGGLRRVDPTYQTDYGVSMMAFPAVIVFYIVVGLVVVLSLAVGRRAFCHSVCWVAPFMVLGTKVRNYFKWPSLRLTSDKVKCTSCKTCTSNCPMSLDVNGMVQRASMQNAECILCGTCIDGCPRGAIRYAFRRGS